MLCRRAPGGLSLRGWGKPLLVARGPPDRLAAAGKVRAAALWKGEAGRASGCQEALGRKRRQPSLSHPGLRHCTPRAPGV